MLIINKNIQNTLKMFRLHFNIRRKNILKILSSFTFLHKNSKIYRKFKFLRKNEKRVKMVVKYAHIR